MLWKTLLRLRKGGRGKGGEGATSDRSHHDRRLANQYGATGASNPSPLTCSLTNVPFAILERVMASNNNNKQNGYSYSLLGYMSSNNAQMFQSVFGNGSTNNGTRRMLKDQSHNERQPARAWELPSAETTDAKNSGQRKRNLVEGSFHTFSNGSSTSSNTNGNSDSNSNNVVIHNTNFAFFSNNLTAQAQALNKDVLLGQECPCASPAAAQQRADNGTTYFCPAGTAACTVVFSQQVNGNDAFFAVPSVGPTISPLMTVYCASSTEDVFLRYLFPLGGVLLIFVTFLFFCSSKGQYARGFCRKIFKRWNEEHYSRELRLDLERIVERSEARRVALERLAQDERRQQTRVSFPDDPTAELAFSNSDIHPVFVQYLTAERRRQANPQLTPVDAATVQTPVRVERSRRAVQGEEVVLRTRRFRRSREIKDGKLSIDPLSLEPDQCPCCSICLVDYIEDDRIANLDCGHVFHVECVKSWIVRKNYCPLCKAVNVTRPQQKEEGSNDGEIAEQGNSHEGVAERAPPQPAQHQSSGPPMLHSHPQPLEIDH